MPSLPRARGLSLLWVVLLCERAAHFGLRVGFQRGFDHVGLDHGIGSSAQASFTLLAPLLALGSLPLTVVADRYLGRQRAVLAGAALATLGGAFLMLGVPVAWSMAFIIVGHAGVRAIVLSLVGDLHGRGDPRRDAAFVWIGLAGWLGASTGAILGSLIGAGGTTIVAYLLAAVLFVARQPELPAEGFSADAEGAPRAALSLADARAIGAAVLAGAGAAFALQMLMNLFVSAPALTFGVAALGIALAITAGLLIRDRFYLHRSAPPLGALAWQRIGVLALLGALVLAAEVGSGRVTGDVLGANLGLFTAQTALAMGFATLAGTIVVALVVRRLDDAPGPPSGVTKIVAGVLLQAAALGLVALAPAVAPLAIVALVLRGLGEVVLVAVGLSLVSKLAPPRYAAFAMACWSLAALLGGTFAGALGGASALDGAIALGLAVVAGLLAALAPRLRALMGGAEDLPAEAPAPGPYR